MHPECELSIITINFNGLKDTCELIDTLPLEDQSIEVIVVDNASKEDEATVIEQRYPQVNVIRSKENLGFAGGNNLGINAAHVVCEAENGERMHQQTASHRVMKPFCGGPVNKLIPVFADNLGNE